MKPTAILIAVFAVLAAPIVAEAQYIGFQVGIGGPGYRPAIGVGRRYNTPGRAVNNPYGNARGIGVQGARRTTVGGFITPRPGFGPSATVVQAGAGFIAGYAYGPSGQVYVPHHQPAVPTHSTAAPVIIVTAGRNRGYQTSHPNVYVPGPAVIVSASSLLGRRGNRNRGSQSVVIQGARLGNTRAEVIAAYGIPIVSRANRNGEALVFSQTTIVIQNGVVTQVTGR